MMRKTVLSICMIAMFLSISIINGFALEKENIKFSDVPESAWFASYVSKLVEMGSINGYGDGTFRPGRRITKAEFIVLVLNALGNKQEMEIDDHWAMNYIREAQSIGILDENEFRSAELNYEIDRLEATKVLVNVLDEEYADDLKDYVTYIEDYARIPEEYAGYVLKAYVKGLVSGYPDGEFKGSEGLTRAEASIMVVKMIDKNERSNIGEAREDLENTVRIQGEEKRENIINTALKFQGVPYRWGGVSPSGFDSSGFIWYVFQQNDIDIPRVSSDIYNFGDPITREELQPGDLVFFEGYQPGPSHGSIYIGDDEFIHSPSTGRTVSIDNLNDPYYWGPRQYGGLRIIK